MDTSLTAELAGRALEMAVRHRSAPADLLHHSDRGIQYVAASYQQRLIAFGMRSSMSRPGC